MADCKKCKHNHKPPTCEPKCNRMCDGESDFEPITNSMRIRAMDDEELAEFLDDLTDNCCRCAEHQNCGNCQIGLDAKTGFCDIKKWLQSEAE